jgi:hypothetical protein
MPRAIDLRCDEVIAPDDEAMCTQQLLLLPLPPPAPPPPPPLSWHDAGVDRVEWYSVCGALGDRSTRQRRGEALFGDPSAGNVAEIWCKEESVSALIASSHCRGVDLALRAHCLLLDDYDGDAPC